MLCSRAFPSQSPRHKRESGSEAEQAGRAAAEGDPSPWGTEAACGPQLRPWEWGCLSALGFCPGSHQAGDGMCSYPQDLSCHVKAVADTK